MQLYNFDLRPAVRTVISSLMGLKTHRDQVLKLPRTETRRGGWWIKVNHKMGNKKKCCILTLKLQGMLGSCCNKSTYQGRCVCMKVFVWRGVYSKKVWIIPHKLVLTWLYRFLDTHTAIWSQASLEPLARDYHQAKITSISTPADYFHFFSSLDLTQLLLNLLRPERWFCLHF